jgi:hypothetical protein
VNEPGAPRKKDGLVRRYFMVVGAIFAVLIGGAVATKPKPEKMREGVEEAMTAYAAAQAQAPEVLKDISLPSHISREHDYIVAVSYEAETGDGKKFSCWGAFIVTVCSSSEGD